MKFTLDMALQTNKAKSKGNELYVKKLIRIVQQFTCQRIISENDKVRI